MLTTILLIVAALVAVILLLAMTKPSSFRVERRGTIQAPPEKIFPLLNDFHNWGKWSPWEKLDPNMTREFGGPENGVGSSYGWKGNSKAGEGRMEITESRSPSRVGLDLNFIKPFKANNKTEFDLTSGNNSTDLLWSMHGPSTFATKVMMVFTSMDKMIGKDFEQGIANLKRVAEQGA